MRRRKEFEFEHGGPAAGFLGGGAGAMQFAHLVDEQDEREQADGEIDGAVEETGVLDHLQDKERGKGERSCNRRRGALRKRPAVRRRERLRRAP